MPKFDLDDMSLSDLKALQREVAQAIETFEARRRLALRRELEEIAKARGFALADVLDLPPPRKRAGRKAAAEKPATAKYRHPENAALTWSGRGRRPGWVTAALEAGRTLEDLRAAG